MGGSRGRPAAAGLGAGTTSLRRARCGALHAQGLSAHCLRGMGPWRGSGISFLHSAGKHPSQEVPPWESGGLPLSSPQDHCGATRLTLPSLQNATARPQGCCLPRWPSQQISGMVQPSPNPSPSSSDSSGISSTVSGKLMRCLSPTGCGSRAESEKPTPLLAAPSCPGWAPSCQRWPCPAALSGPLPGCSQPQPSSTGSWSQSPGAHRDVGFLCDDLEHIRDGNVAKPLCDGQGSGAILCKKEDWVSSSRVRAARAGAWTSCGAKRCRRVPYSLC